MIDGIYCLGCGYNIKGVKKQSCPECGQEFNPGDPKTYAWENENRLPRGAWFVLSLQGIIVCFLLVFLFVVGFMKQLNDEQFIGLFLGFLMISGPLQLMTLFYGSCMALFETNSVIKPKRKLFLAITLSPWVFILTIILVIVLLPEIV